MTNDEKFLGVGIIFPIQLNNGAAVVDTGIPLLRSSLGILLTWPTYTRWMLGEYGSRAEELLENPLDLVTTETMRRYVIDTITDWEKRITLVSVEFSVNDLGTKLELVLQYRVVSSKQLDTFVFPFYEKIIY